MTVEVFAEYIGYVVIFVGSITITFLFAFLASYLVYKLSAHIQHYLVDSMGGWKTFLEYREWYHKNKNR